jgi:hypothetical protein
VGELDATADPPGTDPPTGPASAPVPTPAAAAATATATAPPPFPGPARPPAPPPAQAPPRRPHRGLRRRPATRRELLLVAAVAAAAGVAAVRWSPAAPTGLAAVDGAERFLVAAAVAVAGSRARRWTLVLGATAATVAAVLDGAAVDVAAAVAALAATLVLVETRTRDRVLGAAVAGAVAVLALRFTLPGPIIVEVVAALAATVPILASGYRRSTPRTRRAVRWAALAAAVVAALAVLAAGVAAATSAGDVLDGARATERGVDAARDGDGAASAAAFDRANDRFRAARARIGSWWAAPARAVPVLGVNLGAVVRAVDAGTALTAAAPDLVRDVEFTEVRRPDGGADLGALAALKPRVGRARAALADAADRLGPRGSPWLVAPLADRLDEFAGRLATTRGQADDAAVALDGLPWFLGADAPRRYLFLFGNPAEARDLGGHIGNWAEVTTDGGRIELVDVGGPLELSVPPGARPPDLAERFPPSLLSMDPFRYPQNLGATPDLPTAARAAAEVFERRTGRPVDAVAYADPAAFAAFVALVGPVEVGGLPEPFQVTAENAVAFLTRDQYTMFPSDSAAGDALEALIETVFDRLTATRLASPARLGELFAPLVAQGRFRLATVGADRTGLLEHFGLTGAVPAPAGGDVLGVFTRNAGPSKIDAFLDRPVRADLRWDPASGRVRSVVTVRLANSAPAEGLPRTVVGNNAGVPPGTNLTDLVVLTPHRLRAVLVDGQRVAAQPLLESDLWRHTVRVAVPPGATRTVHVHLDGEVDPGPVYRLAWVGRPQANPAEATLRLRSAGGPVRPGTVTVDSSTDTVVRWRVEGAP